MTWTWQLEKADGTIVPARDQLNESFSSQGDAESWLGEHWPGLLKARIEQVTLLEDGRAEYGPMSLHPPEE
jgi:hypothetical protein